MRNLIFNSEKLARELFKTTRGNRSQKWINKKLGLNFNFCYKVESGARNLYWEDYCSLLRIMNIPGYRGFQKIKSIKSIPQNPSEALRTVIGNISITEFAKSLDISHSKGSRLLSGKSKLPLSVMLLAVHKFTNQLEYFLSQYIDIMSIPSLQEHAKLSRMEKELITQFPVVAALIETLIHREYLESASPNTEILANLLNLDISTINNLLERLVRLGIVTQSKGYYHRSSRHIELSNLDSTDLKNINEYWLEHCLKKLKARDNSKYFQSGFLVYSTSNELEELIQERYKKFYWDIISLIRNPPHKYPVEQVKVLSVCFSAIAHSDYLARES